MEVNGVTKDKLYPQQAWKDQGAFAEQARALRLLFLKNFRIFYSNVAKNVQDAYDELNF